MPSDLESAVSEISGIMGCEFKGIKSLLGEYGMYVCSITYIFSSASLRIGVPVCSSESCCPPACSLTEGAVWLRQRVGNGKDDEEEEAGIGLTVGFAGIANKASLLSSVLELFCELPCAVKFCVFFSEHPSSLTFPSSFSILASPAFFCYSV